MPRWLAWLGMLGVVSVSTAEGQVSPPWFYLESGPGGVSVVTPFATQAACDAQRALSTRTTLPCATSIPLGVISAMPPGPFIPGSTVPLACLPVGLPGAVAQNWYVCVPAQAAPSP